VLSRCCAREEALSTDLGVRFRRLEESGIVTRCEITTYEPDSLMDLAFNDDNRVQKLIMKVRGCCCSASYPFAALATLASPRLA
jgi:hypothetical protein